MPDASVILQSIIKAINPLNILNKIAIFTFPVWIVFKFFPNTYTSIKKNIIFSPSDLHEITNFIDVVVNILIYVNYTFVWIAVTLTICYIVQHILSFVLGIFDVYIPTENSYRHDINVLIIRLIVYFSIYITSISIYSDLLINYNKPIKIFYSTQAKFVSIIPFTMILIAVCIEMICPIRQEFRSSSPQHRKT